MSTSVRRSGTGQGARLRKIHEVELHNLEAHFGKTRGRKHARQEEQHRRLVDELIPRDRALEAQELVSS